MSRKQPVLHPFLFAAYPILLLWSKNAEEASAGDAVRAFLAFALLVACCLLALRLVLRNSLKSGVISSLLIVLFFSYMPMYEIVEGVQIGSFELGRNRYLLPGWGLVAFVLSVALAFTRRDLTSLSNYLNIVGAFLLVFCVVGLVFSGPNSAPSNKSTDQWRQVIAAEMEKANQLRWVGKGDLPDIYYIILDQYARQDILQRDFGFDNSEFIQYLRDKGFYVADGSRTNYPHTHWSLPSSLNFEKLDTLGSMCGVEVMTYGLLQETIKESRARHLLEKMGYRYIQPSSAFSITADGSDVKSSFLKEQWRLREFDRALIDSTMLGPLKLADAGARQSHLTAFAQLQQISQLPEPTFSFVHICCPHPPYVFKRDGSSPSLWSRLSTSVSGEQHDRYIEQLEYLNVLTRRAIDSILAPSGSRPIIIIQADHGHLPFDFFNDPKWDAGSKKARNAMDMRTAILNAYYFPNSGDETLYDTITPVNSFRALLNTYFGAQYDLLEDTIYFPKNPVEEWNPPCRKDNMTDISPILRSL